MGGLLFLGAFFAAAIGAALIGVALNGQKRRRRRRELAAAKATRICDLAEAAYVRTHGKVVPAGDAPLKTAITNEDAVWQKLVLEEWIRDWMPVLAQQYGGNFHLEDDGKRVRVVVDGCKLLLEGRGRKSLSKLFDEEDIDEYLVDVPEAFAARCKEHVLAHPGTYRVRLERLAVGDPVYALGRVEKEEDELVLRQRTDGEERELFVSDLGHEELFAPPSWALIVASWVFGIALVVTGGFFLWHSR
ncbi:MAG: hypothetical protein HOO96_09815 [Polyangiaceae bacterium]|nr:hypothetical protein [Polyangiaceae bacterium]